MFALTDWAFPLLVTWSSGRDVDVGIDQAVVDLLVGAAEVGFQCHVSRVEVPHPLANTVFEVTESHAGLTLCGGKWCNGGRLNRRGELRSSVRPCSVTSAAQRALGCRGPSSAAAFETREAATQQPSGFFSACAGTNHAMPAARISRRARRCPQPSAPHGFDVHLISCALHAIPPCTTPRANFFS